MKITSDDHLAMVVYLIDNKRATHSLRQQPIENTK